MIQSVCQTDFRDAFICPMPWCGTAVYRLKSRISDYFLGQNNFKFKRFEKENVNQIVTLL